MEHCGTQDILNASSHTHPKHVSPEAILKPPFPCQRCPQVIGCVLAQPRLCFAMAQVAGGCSCWHPLFVCKEKL